MKKIILLLFLALAFVEHGKAQTANDTMNYTINLILPKKAIWGFAYYRSLAKNWADRKLPDALKALTKTDNNPDSLINVTVAAGQFADYLNLLQAERNEAVRDFYRSVLLNQPAITGYTALVTQVTNKASTGTGNEKGAAIYIKDKYLNYQNTLINYWNNAINSGKSFINN